MHQIFERSENWCKTAKTLTIKLQTKESHAFLVCLLGASASQVRYIDIPVLPVDEFPAKMLVEHVTVVHQVGRQWTLRSAQIPETANLLIWKATRRVNWHEVQWELLDCCGLFNITGACFFSFRYRSVLCFGAKNVHMWSYLLRLINCTFLDGGLDIWS